MQHTRTPAIDIAYHKHFVETVRHALNGVCRCLVGWVIAAGGVAFTLLRSGWWAGRLADPGTRHPWAGCCLVLCEHHLVLAQKARLIPRSLPFGARRTPNGNSLNFKAVLQMRELMMNPLNRTKTIGIKVSESSFENLRKFAESQGKPLSEWCRDTITAAFKPPTPRPSDFAVVAEITATQAILIDMLCVLGRDVKIGTAKAQEIVDRAHNAKFKEAIQLFRFAYANADKFRIEAPVPGEHEGKEEQAVR